MSDLPPPRLGDRSLFPDLEAIAYLNHAGISPASAPVRDAVRALVDDYCRRGSGAIGAWLEQRSRLRGKLARLVGAAAEDVAFVPNTTNGVTDVALSFPWTKGDRVVVFAGEFPANVTPWQRAAALFGLEIVMLSTSDYEASWDEGLAKLEATLAAGGVKLVAVSLVEFQTGLRMPVQKMASLCHAHGAELFVDAVQAAGVVPIDVRALGVDYLAAGAHKWLMGLEGAGFLYVSPARVGALRPATAGWLSHEDPLGFLFEGAGKLRYDRPIRRRADFLEGGNVNGAGLAALEASVDCLLAIGIDAIFAHVNAYGDALEPELVARGFESVRPKEAERRGGAVGVRPPPGVDLRALHAALARRGVVCATPDGVLRFSPHWPNAVGEVPGVLRALDEAMREARTGA